MISFDLDIGNLDEELSKGLKAALNSTVAEVAGRAQNEALNLAGKKLKSGLKHWEKGFSVNKIEDGVWVLTISGKLATMMEEGFQTGEIKKMLLNGNRAKQNAVDGKKYVDVPIALDADSVTGKIGKTNIQVSQFKSADEMIKNITTSDWAKGSLKKQQRITKRVKDVIQSRPKDSENTQYLTIRRVSEKSKGWPTNPYDGAHVLDKLDSFLEKAFEQSLESLI